MACIIGLDRGADTRRYIAFGVFGCMASLIVEAALVANFVPSTNTNALNAAVAMFFVFQVFYALCLDGTQFAYLGGKSSG